MGKFEYFDHAADVGLAAQADSLPELFVTAAVGLMQWIGPAPGTPVTVLEDVTLEGTTLDDLLVRWLQELLYLFQQRRAYWVEVPKIEISGRLLEATVLGSEWDEAAAFAFQEVKAVTYHQAQVVESGGGWRARVILDI